MSNSKESEIPDIKIRKTPLKMTPPGYEIVLSEAQAQALTEMMSKPGWKVLKTVFVAQRKDHIARMALNSSEDFARLRYFQGMAAELALFFSTTQTIKKAYLKEEESSQEDRDKD